MINKLSKLPSIAGLTDKPASITSGKPLKEKVKICYRSDLYMKEQQKSVQLFQEQLRQALNDLKTAKPDSLQFHTQRVEQLKVKADEMIIILQICGKINRELAYARQDLLSAVEKGAESQLINKRRKRVQWLETKLEQITIQHSPARKEDVDDGESSDVDFGVRYSDMGNNSVIGKSAMSSFPADMSRLQTADSDERLNTAGTAVSQFQLSLNGALPEEIIGANETGNRLVLSSKPDNPAKPIESTDIADITPMSEGHMDFLSATQHRPTHSKLSFREPLESGEGSPVPRMDTSQAEDQEDHSIDYDDEDYDDDDDDDDDDADDERSDRDSESRGDGKTRSRSSAVSSLLTDVTDEETRKTRRSSRRKSSRRSPKSKQSQGRPTREHTRVTLKSPDEKSTQAEKEMSDLSSRDYLDSSLSSMSIDLAVYSPDLREGLDEEYWDSEHHRVEFSALRPYLSELDPNSLHQVAIAVPGNYVSKPSSERQAELPWREDEDNRDVNRDALDRLSRQIIQIQDKVYEAAIKSVDSLGNRIATRASRRDFSSVTKAAGISVPPSRQFTQTAASLPPLSEQPEDSQNRFTPVVHLKYYSKEIPKAKTLPISRVELSSFVFADPDGRPAPERLVNQGRLYNDTKLVIYRAPNRKRPDYREEAKIATITQSAPTMTTDKTQSSISLRTASKVAIALGARKTPKGDVPRSHHVGLRWDRVQYLCETSLRSQYVEERQHAAKQLGLLNCPDPVVFHALKTAIIEDKNERVQYEASKALIRLGCLEDELIQILVDYLIVGNEEVRLDMLKTLSSAKGIAFISKAMPSFDELVRVLAHLCKNWDTCDLVSFESAIAFGTICVKNATAVEKMMSYLNNGDDTHKKAVALRILIKQFNESSWNLVEIVLKQFTKSPVWGHRREAAQLLQHLGRKYACSTAEHEELVYSILERRLWDDSVEMVRMESAHTLGVLDMYPRAAESVTKRLLDTDPTTRAHAVTSLGTLGVKQPKVLRMLTEMLELDPSDNVRREIIRAFGSLQITEKRIIRLIKERERGDGILATEAKNVLKILNQVNQAQN